MREVSQSTIFDAIAANEAADQGIARAATHNSTVLEAAKQQAIEIGRVKGEVTADDVQAALMAAGWGEEDLGNAAGSVFRNPKLWLWDDNRTVKSTRVKRHGALIRVWKYIGN